VDVGAEPPRWSRVASEGELLFCAAPADLRYGDLAADKWLHRAGVVGQFRVTNEAFGVDPLGLLDPARGVKKHAEVSYVWTPVALEGERVALLGSPLGAARSARYGAPGGRTLWGGDGGGWVECSIIADGVPVDVSGALFGLGYGADPAPGVRKRLEVAMPPPPTRLLGSPSEPPPGACGLCDRAGAPVLAPCGGGGGGGGGAAHALCLPCALQSLRAELSLRGFGVDLSFPILCALCKPACYPAPPGAPPLEGWWRLGAVEALRAWSGEAGAAALDGQAPLSAREAATFQAHVVAALARAPQGGAERARAARAGLRDAVFVCPNTACAHPCLLERHVTEPFFPGVVMSAASGEAPGGAEGGGGGSCAAADAPPPPPPPPLRRGAPASCPYCKTPVCLDCGAFWAMGAPGGAGALFPVAGVNAGAHTGRTCGEFAAHVEGLPRGCVGLVGRDASVSAAAEAAGRVASLFVHGQGGGDKGNGVSGGGGGGAREDAAGGAGAVPAELRGATGVKFCPGCGFPGIHPRNHHCHHIERNLGCPSCHTHCVLFVEDVLPPRCAP
jgi:hypothetical protein